MTAVATRDGAVGAAGPAGADTAPGSAPRAARVVVITAGHVAASSTARLGRLVGEAAAASLKAGGRRGSVTHLELRGFATEVTRALITAEQSDEVVAAVASVREADAIVVVTPTINASFSGLLKSFLDVLPAEALRSVPTTIAATGGTQRHTLVLDQAVRPMLGFQRAMVLPTCLYVTADEWEGPRPSAALAERIAAAGAELAAFIPVR